MIRIAISVEAFDAIARTLPLGSVGYEAEANRARRALRLAGGGLGRQARLDARAGESLQRRHPRRDASGEYNDDDGPVLVAHAPPKAVFVLSRSLSEQDEPQRQA